MVRQTADGGYIMAGNTPSADDDRQRLYVVKTCAEGHGLAESEPWF